jgi:phosphoribosylglycinamide formyltransferase 1
VSDKTVRIGVLASGRGSNLQSIIDAISSGHIRAEIAVVISDKNGAFALERAVEAGIPAEFIDPKNSRRREDYDLAVLKRLRAYKVDLVLLAGYMRIVTMTLVEAFENSMMNIHPALLPSFPGLHVQRKAIEHGVRFSGCTVHFVDGGMDTGPIIIQAVVPVLPDDTEDTLSHRILAQEHRIYPEAVKLFVEGRLTVDDRRVLVKDQRPHPEKFIVNPAIEG